MQALPNSGPGSVPAQSLGQPRVAGQAGPSRPAAAAPSTIGSNHFPHDGTPKDLEDMSVYNAIGVVAHETGGQFTVKEIKGHFSETKGAHPEAIVDEQDGNFKFNVRFEAKIMTESGQEKTVTFVQTIFTDVKAPTGYNLQEFENAKKEAYQIAKSYELIQRNLAPPPTPANMTDAQNRTMDVLKREKNIAFVKAEGPSLSSHTIVPLKAFTVDSRTELPLTAKKTDQATGATFDRIAIMERKEITCKPNLGVPLSIYENHLSSGPRLPTKPTDEDLIEYPKFLESKLVQHESKFNERYDQALTEVRSVNAKLGSEAVVNLKNEYLRLQQDNQNGQNDHRLNVLKEKIFAESGISNLEASQLQLYQFHKQQDNVQLQLIDFDENRTSNLDQRALSEYNKTQSLWETIQELKDKALQSAPSRPIIVSEENELSGSEIEPGDLSATPSGSGRINLDALSAGATPAENPNWEEDYAGTAQNAGFDKTLDDLFATTTLRNEAKPVFEERKIPAGVGEPTTGEAGSDMVVDLRVAPSKNEGMTTKLKEMIGRLWKDIGQRIDYLKARKDFNQKGVDVTIETPQNRENQFFDNLDDFSKMDVSKLSDKELDWVASFIVSQQETGMASDSDIAFLNAYLGRKKARENP